MDAYDMLDLTVEEAMKSVKRTHRLKAEAYYRYEFDFSEEVEAPTYEEALEKMAKSLSDEKHYATTFSWQEILTISLPVKDDEYGDTNLQEFTCVYNRTHIYDYSGNEIAKHPAFIAGKEAAAKAAIEKRASEEAAKLKAKKKADRETYERLKKEFGE